MSDEKAAASRLKQQVVQKKTFMRWCNTHLQDRNIQMVDLYEDFKDGVELINLLEIISAKKLGKYRKQCKVKIHRLENLTKAIEFLTEEGIKLVNIDSADIESGNPVPILGLIWTLILRWQIQKGDTGGKGSSAKSELLAWINSQIAPKKAKNFTSDWQDGDFLNALLNSVSPGSTEPTGEALDDINKAMTVAETQLSIPRVMDAEDMRDHPEELSMMTYLSYYRDAWERLQNSKPSAGHSYADGPGLEAAHVGEEAHFTVHLRDADGGGVAAKDGQLSVKVTDGAGVELKTEVASGSADPGVRYTPEHEGELTITVAVDGESIKGMPVTVNATKLNMAGQSYAEGAGLQGALVGQPNVFTVYVQDDQGAACAPKDLAISVKSAGEELKTEQESSGEHGSQVRVTYRPTQAGEVHIAVQLGLDPVKNTPAVVKAIQGASASGSVSSFTFTIQSCVASGEAKTVGGDKFEVTVEAKDGTAVEVECRDNSDGTYTASFKCGPGKTTYTVSCKLNGKHIPSSPWQQGS